MAVGILAVRVLCVQELDRVSRKKKIEQENNSSCLGPVTSFSVCKMHEKNKLPAGELEVLPLATS